MDVAIRATVVLISAALLSVISTPIEIAWLHWVVYLPMLWVVRAETPRANFWYGGLYGAFGTALLFRWLVPTIAVFGPLPWSLSLGILVLFAIAFGSPHALVWWAVHPLRRRVHGAWVLLHPAFVVVVDYIASYILLFPYQDGVAQYKTLDLWQLVSVTGIWGPTFLAFFANEAFGEAIYRVRERRPLPRRGPIAAVATVAAIATWGHYRYERVEAVLKQAPTLRVAQLQTEQGMEYRIHHSGSEALEEWVDLTRRVPPGAADLVVWPEGACPYDLNVPANSKVVELIGGLARGGGFAMVVGSGAREARLDPDGKTRKHNFNTTYFFGKDGKVAGRYDKMVPLPFGEYVPFARVLPWLRDAIPGIGDFEAGRVPFVWSDGSVRIATPICYEAILGRVCRLFDHPDLLVNVTNDAWFGDTAAPHQHAMLAAERAVELGIPMYRSGYTGVSMAVEPHGVIHSETSPFQEVARIVTVRLGHVDTIYALAGDWFVAVCGIGLSGALLAARRKRTSDGAGR
jgi:apolipoprotein N-acyltransferase